MHLERDFVSKFLRHATSRLPVVRKAFLGAILIATGQITRAQLRDALHRQVTSGRRLGDELIDCGQASRAQIDRGLFLQQKLIAGALIVATVVAPLSLAAPPVEAGQTASMQVSASVIANIKVRVEHQEEQLKITEADLARGHIDVRAGSRFSVSTNSRLGYRMEFYPIGNLFESVQIDGLADSVRLGVDGGTIVQRAPLPLNTTQELSYHFVLRPGTTPGTYPWPLVLSVRAIS